MSIRRIKVKYAEFIPTLSIIKGYVHYKMMTSQNVSSEPQIKNFFIL